MIKWVLRRRRSRRGAVTVDLPDAAVAIPDEKTLAADAAVLHGKRMRERLAKARRPWHGLGPKTASRVTVSGGEVSVPDRPDGSVGRMAKAIEFDTVDGELLEQVLEEHLARAVFPTAPKDGPIHHGK